MTVGGCCSVQISTVKMVLTSKPAAGGSGVAAGTSTTAWRHKCGIPNGRSTYWYILSRDAEAEGSFKFVSKNTEEGIKTLKELGWEKTD